jgi:2'-5' RNA ligase
MIFVAVRDALAVDPRMARLFAAVIPPSSVRTELAALEEPLEGVRWTPEANLHLTLRFIGETGEEKAGRFAEALAAVRVEPFILPVGGVGLFASRGPAHVLWVGTGGSHPRLFQLRQRVDEALLRVDLALDVRHFHPHLTIARLTEQAAPKKIARWIEQREGFEAPPFRVDAFHLVASESAGGGLPHYRITHTFTLHKD